VTVIDFNVEYFRQKVLSLSIIINIMEQRKIVLLPRVQQILDELGENIKLARLRRKLSTMQVSERANLSRQTIVSIEKGMSGVSIGAYLQVLFVLGLEKDMLTVAGDDLLGRKLQDSKLLVKSRAPKSTKTREE
jgi:DNA-binding XRE family transcriptional regulator